MSCALVRACRCAAACMRIPPSLRQRLRDAAAQRIEHVAPSVAELRLQATVSTREAHARALASLAAFSQGMRAASDAQLEQAFGITPFAPTPTPALFAEHYGAGVALLAKYARLLNALAANNRALVTRSGDLGEALQRRSLAAMDATHTFDKLQASVGSLSGLRDHASACAHIVCMYRSLVSLHSVT